MFAFSKRITAAICVLCIIASNAAVVFAQNRETIIVQVNRPGAAISKTMYGLFFEDINFAADGGIYPERIKNRSFEFPDPMMGWSAIKRDGYKGATYIVNQASFDKPSVIKTASDTLSADNANRRFLRLAADADGKGFGIANEGFRGIGIEQNAEYSFSVYARQASNVADKSNGVNSLIVEIADANGRKLGDAAIKGLTAQWKEYKATIRATTTSNKANLNLMINGGGAVDVDLVSLYPKATFNNRPNGLRPDLVKLLKDMKPGFLRFPGGCIVEGRTLEQRYQWKTTVGDLDDRQLIVNRWNTEFKHRLTPDYYQSFGLGFYEYFQLSEDIGAEPLPILNCGMACQFNSGELAALDDIDSYIQDALDLIAFANDPVTTEWGKKRAAFGHPAPFNLKMIGIGNEQWGAQYIERYKVFHKVLKEKHPEIQLISSVGPAPDGERFDFLWNQLRELKTDIVDEHYYSSPQWFRENANRYDDYPRTGPKVFAGEFAAQSVGIASPDNRNTWECALSEAAFMTGLERNADIVIMASYAPLFAHIDAWQWTPNMIWFDNLRSYATPNYYVQQMFSANKGTRILPVANSDNAKNGANNLFTSASLDQPGGEVILKIVNTAPVARTVKINLAAARNISPTVKTYTLTAMDAKAENSLEQPRNVAPIEKQIKIQPDNFTYQLAANSLTVLRVKGTY